MANKYATTFEAWMKKVDDAVAARIGLSVHDLVDIPFYDLYERGVSPKSAASKAIKASGGMDNPRKKNPLSKHVKTFKGVYYFPSRAMATRYANEHNWPIDRIQEYGRGWTIQGGVGGDHAGPHGLKIGAWGGMKNPRKRARHQRLHHRAHYSTGSGAGPLAMEGDRAILRIDYSTHSTSGPLELKRGEPVFITMIPTGGGDDATVYVQAINRPEIHPVPVAMSALIWIPGKGRLKKNPRKNVKGREKLRAKRRAILARNLQRRKNPDAYVIALYSHGKRLTFDATRNRFTDNSKPSIYRTAIAAKNRADDLLARNAKLSAYKITVEPADATERGAVFGARPRRNPGKRTKFGIGVKGKTLTLFKAAEMPTAASHGSRFNAVIGMFATRTEMEKALAVQRRGSNVSYQVIDETRRPKT